VEGAWIVPSRAAERARRARSSGRKAYLPGLRCFLVTEQLLSVAIDRAVEAVWRKLEKGERLKVEDLVVLMIATVRDTHSELGRLRESFDRTVANIHLRVDRLSERIDAMTAELNARIDETNKRIDETNKRIDGVYGVLGDLQKTLAGMQDAMLEMLKTLAELHRDVAELKEAMLK